MVGKKHDILIWRRAKFGRISEVIHLTTGLQLFCLGSPNVSLNSLFLFFLWWCYKKPRVFKDPSAIFFSFPEWVIPGCSALAHLTPAVCWLKIDSLFSADSGDQLKTLFLICGKDKWTAGSTRGKHSWKKKMEATSLGVFRVSVDKNKLNDGGGGEGRRRGGAEVITKWSSVKLPCCMFCCQSVPGLCQLNWWEQTAGLRWVWIQGGRWTPSSEASLSPELCPHAT